MCTDEANGRDGSTSVPASPRKVLQMRINLSGSKYQIFRILQQKLGWQDVSSQGDDGPWDICWTDTSVSAERVLRLKPHQRLNHFHGMLDICLKRSMARHLQRMAALAPQQYDFFPTTFVLPVDLPALLADAEAAGRRRAYILKPDAGCQGKGIRLVQSGSRSAMLQALQAMAQSSSSSGSSLPQAVAGSARVVAQHYLPHPLLLHGYKFDLRVYALVAGADPLRVYVHRQGLVRLCTRRYKAPKPGNLSVSFMHLTNYAINKKNSSFVANCSSDSNVEGAADGASDSSKWYLSQLQQHLQAQGHCWDQVWSSIQQLVVKALLPVQPQLQHHCRALLGRAAAVGPKTPRAAADAAEPRTTAAPQQACESRCFELLGFDIMLDAQLRPWLIEINHSPSFNIDSPLDRAVKEQVLGDTLTLVAPRPRAEGRARRSQRCAAEARLLAGLPSRTQPHHEQPLRPPSPAVQACSIDPLQPPQPPPQPSPQQQQQATADIMQGNSSCNDGYSSTAHSNNNSPRVRKGRPLGGFELVFPALQKPELQASYEQLLALAHSIFKGAAAPGRAAVPGTPRGRA